MVTTFHYLMLSAVLFTIGVIGVLTRRNIMIILMSIELMMNAVNINLIAFSDRLDWSFTAIKRWNGPRVRWRNGRLGCCERPA